MLTVVLFMRKFDPLEYPVTENPMVMSCAHFNATNHTGFCSGISVGCWLEMCPYGREQTKIRCDEFKQVVLAHITNSLKEKSTYSILT